jgi:hypothetical protein
LVISWRPYWFLAYYWGLSERVNMYMYM